MKLFKKKDKPTPEQIKRKAAQDWLPFQDIASFIYRRDGHLVSVLRVEPMNLTLKSDNEKKRIITALHEALNGQLEPLQIFCLPRPVDLDTYLESLQTQARETINPMKKRLLQEYIQYVASVVKGGEAIEHRYYILISQKPGKHDKDELSQKTYELAMSLERSGLKINVCDDTAILDMLFSFLQPTQAAFEPTPTRIGVTTIYKEG